MRKLKQQQEEHEDRRREDQIYDNAKKLLAKGENGTGADLSSNDVHHYASI